MASIMIWSILEAIEKSITTVPGKILCSQFQYIGIASTPVLFLIFSARYSHQDSWLTPPVKIILSVVPITTIIMVATNHHHMLHWSGFSLDQETQFLTYHYGPWFWVFTVVAYFYLVFATILLWRASLYYRDQRRWQYVLIVLAGLVPWIANAIHLLRLIPVKGIDPTPLAFAISGFLLALNITEIHLIDLAPIARTKLVDTLGDAIIVVNHQNIVVDVNPAALNLIALPQQEVLQKPAVDTLTIWPYLANRFSRPHIEATELRVIPGANQRWYDCHIATLSNDKGELTGYLIVLRDITERRTTEDELSRLAAVIEQAHESILITNLEGEIVYANPHFYEVTGYSIEDARGQKPNLLKSGHHPDSFYKELWETIESGNDWTGTFINKRKDGSEYYGAGTIFPIKRGGGEISHYAAVTRDISAEVIAQEALNFFTRQLTTLHEINIEIGQLSKTDDLYRQIVFLGATRLGLERLCLRLVDPKDPQNLIGTFCITENNQLKDERAFCQPISKDHIFNRLVFNKVRVLNLQNESIRDWNGKILGTGDISIAGIWDKDNLIGYVSSDNLISGRSISEQVTTILVLYSQTISNLIVRIREEEALQSFSENLAALHDISIELSQSNSISAFSKQALDLGHHRLGFDRIQMWFINPHDPREIIGSFRIENHGYILDERFHSTAFEKHPYFDLFSPEFNRIIHQQSTQIFNLKSEMLGNGDLVAASLWAGQTIFGYLIIDNEFSGKPFTSYDLDLIALFAQTIGSTNTRIRGTLELQKKAIQQEFLNEITRMAIEQTDFDLMLQTLVNRLGELFRANGVFITLWDDENQIIQPGAVFGTIQEMYAAEIDHIMDPEEPTLSETIIAQGQVMTVEAVETSDLQSIFPPHVQRAKSLMGLPLIANRNKLGAAVITFNQRRQISQEEIALGRQAAQQIALAILKTRLLEEAEKRATEAETLRQASTAVASTLQREIAIERILEELNRVVPYDSASVQLLVGSDLEIVGERGFKNPDSVLGLRFPVSVDTPNSVVFSLGEPFIIDDAQASYAAFREPPHDHIRGWMGVPLKVHDKVIGMLALDSIQPGRFSSDHSRLATAFADQVAIALENTRLFEETRWLAIHDSLTGIYNRRQFMSLAWAEFHRSVRYNTPLSVMMLDIDHFKRVNDTHGHLTGDQVLRFIARLCEKNLRVNDLIGRYGGEEFVILLPETTATSSNYVSEKTPLEIEPAKIVAERLRKAVESATISTDRADINITVSLGIAELSSEINNIEQLIDRADLALLEAKNRGRNRIVLWPPNEV
jgi:diguanylate cyclase (GGDEF)-like protein/PAS domain S-box-containing protein